VIGNGVAVNLLNPKLTVFFLAFLPQFVPAGTPRATERMLGLSAVFMAATFVVFVAYGVFTGSYGTA
jgi:threonine/homoserine/homoserine lactone efflux protein